MTGRPQAAEAAPYYFTYIDRVTADDVMATFIAQLDELAALFETISDEQSLHRYGPDKWSVREVVSHINDTERAFAFRALWFGRGFDSALPGFDQNISVAGAKADAVEWAKHVEEFAVIRRSTIALFAQMPPEAWSRGGIASDNFVTVRALAYIIAGHVAHHVAILKERYLTGA